MNLNLTLLPVLLLATPSTIPPLHTYHALAGRPSYLEIFQLCLGLQIPLKPSNLNEGEYPACAAMTTGYVFRVENSATVMFLQRLGTTGHLVTVDVSPADQKRAPQVAIATLPTIALIICILSHLQDASIVLLLSLSLLVLSRLLSVLSIRARTTPSWHGASEPGVHGDLLILLSEDRWIRMKGLVDDLKAVTSGSWLSRPKYPGVIEALDWMARVLVYLAVVVLAGASDAEKVILVGTVMVGHLMLMCKNSWSGDLSMNGRWVMASKAPGSVKKYGRRLEMAEELVKEVGRSDFAIRLGMINPEQAKATTAKTEGKVEPGSEVATM